MTEFLDFNDDYVPRRGVIPAHRELYNTNELVYFEGNSNYTNVYQLARSRPLLASKTLKYFDERLPGFVRISKRYLINPIHVTHRHWSTSRSLTIELTGGQRIVVARRRTHIVLRQLESVSLPKTVS